MKNLISFKNFLLDILFPIECLSCEKEGKWICGKCLLKIKRIQKKYCPACDSPTAHGEFCSRHKNEFRLNGLIAPFDYKNPLLEKAIKTYKYRFVKDLSAPLGLLLSLELRKHYYFFKNPLLVPVPLHPRKEKWRGFNQAKLLAQKISENRNIPVQDFLKRTRYTLPQVDLKKEIREKNVSNAFGFIPAPNINLEDKTLILVDDIATTVSTLEECAKILYSNGAREIWGLVLARG